MLKISQLYENIEDEYPSCMSYIWQMLSPNWPGSFLGCVYRMPFWSLICSQFASVACRYADARCFSSYWSLNWSWRVSLGVPGKLVHYVTSALLVPFKSPQFVCLFHVSLVANCWSQREVAFSVSGVWSQRLFCVQNVFLLLVLRWCKSTGKSAVSPTPYYVPFWLSGWTTRLKIDPYFLSWHRNLLIKTTSFCIPFLQPAGRLARSFAWCLSLILHVWISSQSGGWTLVLSTSNSQSKFTWVANLRYILFNYLNHAWIKIPIILMAQQNIPVFGVHEKKRFVDELICLSGSLRLEPPRNHSKVHLRTEVS